MCSGMIGRRDSTIESKSGGERMEWKNRLLSAIFKFWVSKSSLSFKSSSKIKINVSRISLIFFNFLSTIATEIFIEKMDNATYVSQTPFIINHSSRSQTSRVHTSTKIRILKNEHYSIRYYRIHEEKYRILEAFPAKRSK